MASAQEKQGFVGDLEEKTIVQLKELLLRQQNLLKNRKFIHLLKDRGRKIEEFIGQLEKVIKHKSEILHTTAQLSKMSIDDGIENDNSDQQKPLKCLSQLSSQTTDNYSFDHVDKMKLFEEKSVPKTVFLPHRSLRTGDIEKRSSINNELDCKGYRSTFDTDSDDIITNLTLAEMMDLEKHLNLMSPNIKEADIKCLSQYYFIYYDIQPNGVGSNNTEICQIYASADAGNTSTFSQYCIPPYLSKLVTEYTGLKISYKNGQRVLIQSDEIMNTVDKTSALKNFKTFVDNIRMDTMHVPEAAIILYTSSLAVQRLLLYNFKTCGVLPPVVYYAHSKPFLKYLTSEGLIQEPTLKRLFSKLNCKLDIRICDQRCKALKNTLSSRLFDMYAKDVAENSSCALCESACQDVEYIIALKKNLNSMRGKLFDFAVAGKNIITQDLAYKIATAGLSYEILRIIYSIGKKEFMGILALPPVGSPDHAPRVTRDVLVLKNLMKHFDKRQIPTKYEGALKKIHTDKALSLPLDESLRLQKMQKEKYDNVVAKHAAERLVNPIGVVERMVKFTPDVSNPAVSKYRDVVNYESDESENELQTLD